MSEELGANVVSFFTQHQRGHALPDPLEILLEEGTEEVMMTEFKPDLRKMVLTTQDPDQSLFVLEEQLRSVRSRLDRMKFYLSEIEDILLKNL